MDIAVDNKRYVSIILTLKLTLLLFQVIIHLVYHLIGTGLRFALEYQVCLSQLIFFTNYSILSDSPDFQRSASLYLTR